MTRLRRGNATVAAAGDRALLRRTARTATWQAASALAVVLIVIGAVAYFVDVRAQDREISGQLSSVVTTVDDVEDPPPGMALAIRDRRGLISVSRHAPAPTRALLDGADGFTSLQVNGVDYRALVIDRSGERIAAVLDLSPWQTGRSRLLEALAVAEIAGVVGAIAVAALLSHRAIRPLAVALSMQRRFVADASHELRAPLTVLHTRTQLLALRAKKLDLDAILRRQLDELVDDTRVLGEVVEDLLTAASMQSDPQHHELVDIASVCEEVRRSTADHADELGIGLSVSSEQGTDATIEGTRSSLRRAIVALTDNALAHSGPGDRVELRLHRTGARVTVVVADTGSGIDPSVSEHLFARFAHGDGHTAGERHYGIGLALVREIVEAHHGRISVSSSPGHGSRFTLEFPAASRGEADLRP